MLVIGIAHAKGGAGKTTLAQVLASGLVAQGKRVVLIDCDRERQLGRWPEIFAAADWESVPKPVWPEALVIRRESEVARVEAILATSAETGVDVAIIDTEGGRRSQTEQLIYSCDLLLLPSSIRDKDLDLLYETYDWLDISRTANADRDFPLVMVVKSDMPASSRQRSDAAAVLAELDELPCLRTQIPSRQVFAQISVFGPLDQAATAFARAHNINAQHLRAGARIALDLVQEIEEMMA